MGDHELVLYHYSTCPYCWRVRRYLDQQNIVLPEKNIREDPEARRELFEAGGKSQVPALMIDGEVLYESDDIIRWVERNLVQAAEAG